MHRRGLLVGGAAAAAGLALPVVGPAWAQGAWPDRPIRFLVPFAPGGNTDAVGRLAAQFFAPRLGASVSIVVENRGGAGGIVGTEAVAKSPPNGSVFLVGSIGSITIAPAFERLPYDPLNDLAPISPLNTNPLVLIARRGFAPGNVQEVVALARSRPEAVTYGSSGVGGLMHVSALLMEARTGAKLAHVPYRGGAPAVMALVAGEVDLVFANMSDALPQVQAGTVRPIAVTTSRRSAQLPEVPTMQEAGIAEFAAESWNALFAPAGTPRPIVERMAQLAAEMAADPGVRERMAGFGSVAVSSTPEEFARALRQETAQWADAIRRAGIPAPG